MSVRKFATELRVALFEGEPVPEVIPLVEPTLIKRLSGDLRGPRGGRYVPVGEITIRKPTEVGADFMFGAITYRAERMARYVRPRKVPA